MNPSARLLASLAIISLFEISAHAQTNTFPASGNVGIGTTAPAAKLELHSDAPASLANLMLTSGQDRTPRIRFNGPWSVVNSMESYAQIEAINDNGGPGNSAASLHFFTSSGDPAVLSDKMMITGTGNVGIGTTNPQYKLTVGGPLAVSRTGSFVVSGYDTADLVLGSNGETRNGYAQANGSHIMLKSSAKSTITALDEGENLGQISYQNLKWTIGEDVGWGAQTISIPGNVGIGTTNPTHKLAVNGTIKAKEIIVETTGWSDYVFAADYALAPLSEVEAHIKEHKHLPGIPSAAQVAEQGVSVGDMQARLLAKIEELTLHQIAQEKRAVQQAVLATEQAKEIAALRAQIAELKTTHP